MAGLAVILSLQLAGQNPMAGKKVLDIPLKYIVPEEKVSLSKQTERMPETSWIVYSDRMGNITSNRPEGRDEFKTLGFLEKFYVLDEFENELHIVKDPGLTYLGTLSSKAVNYGYIKKDKILLWPHCLVTEKGNIDKKAMVLNTIETAKARDYKKEDWKVVPFFQDPGFTKTAVGKSQLYEIFFIYKSTDEGVLLGRKAKISAGINIDDNIVGWMPKKRINIWNHRIALEPNSNEWAAKERKASTKNLKTKIFIDAISAIDYGDGGEPSDRNVFWDADTYDERPIGEWRRFPVLKINKKLNYYHAGVMGEIHSDKGVLSQIEQADIQKENSNRRQSRRHVNIVFVIDGTWSMGPYFKSVATAINKSMDKLKDEFNNLKTLNQLEFGAVIYRDFLDGDKKIEIQPLTSTHSTVSKWISGRLAKNYGDTDKPEAVFYGLNKALRSVGLNVNETNVIILVGDAGNHNRDDETKVESYELVNKLAELNCHFLAFQVNNDGSHETYNEFKTQMKELISGTASKLYNKNKTKDKEFSKLAGKKPVFSIIEANKESLNKDAAIRGILMYPPKGQSIDPGLLENEISELVNFLDAYTSDFIGIIDQIMERGEGWDEVFEQENAKTKNSGEEVSAFKGAVLNYLADLNVSTDQLEKMIEENYQLYIEAYTPIKHKNLKEPFYDRVLFLTRLELSKILGQMEKLAEARSSGNRRIRLRDTWKEILREHIGEVSDEVLENMTMEQASERVFGLPGTSKLLKEVRLKDIVSESVSEIDISKYCQLIDRKFDRLHKIFGAEKYDYSFSSGDETYFWLQESLLP
jgi:TssR protein VWA domain/TssR protein N-terminal barrel domain/TssR C-terminal domain